MFRGDLIAPINALLARHAKERGDKIAYRDAARAVSYADLNLRTGHLAANLARLGLAPGESVALFLPNSVAWIETCFAILRAGGLAVPIGAESSADEIIYRLTDARCRIVVTTAALAAKSEALRAQATDISKVLIADAPPDDPSSWEALTRHSAGASPRDPDDIDGPAFLVYTSGTTGKAKGVQLSCRSMLWVVAACWAPVMKLGAQDNLLSPLPLYHSYALNLAVLAPLATGASIYLMEKYSTSEALRLLKTGAYTVFPGVPTMFHYLMESAQASGMNALPGLRVCMSAGAILPASLNAAFEAQFKVPLLDGYGITETSTMVTMNGLDGSRVMGSCGLPLAGLAVRIVDAAMRDFDPGEEGELIVRGPNLMLGYLNKPEETAKALRDGWYHTGDLAKADRNGFLTITGRIKELIIRGGQNIAPAEIEDVVRRLDSVLDCAVAALPDAHLGETPGLFVVPRGALDVEAVLRHCREHLSAYKTPSQVHIVKEIPRTGSGKVIRYRLREMAATRAPE